MASICESWGHEPPLQLSPNQVGFGSIAVLTLGLETGTHWVTGCHLSQLFWIVSKYVESNYIP